MCITCKDMVKAVIKDCRDRESWCAYLDKCMIKNTWNPIRKLQYYLSAKRFMAHVFGIDLIEYALFGKIEKD